KGNHFGWMCYVDETARITCHGMSRQIVKKYPHMLKKGSGFVADEFPPNRGVLSFMVHIVITAAVQHIGDHFQVRELYANQHSAALFRQLPQFAQLLELAMIHVTPRPCRNRGEQTTHVQIRQRCLAAPHRIMKYRAIRPKRAIGCDGSRTEKG